MSNARYFANWQAYIPQSEVPSCCRVFCLAWTCQVLSPNCCKTIYLLLRISEIVLKHRRNLISDLLNLFQSTFERLRCHTIKHLQNLFFWIKLKGHPMAWRVVYHSYYCSKTFQSNFYISFILWNLRHQLLLNWVWWRRKCRTHPRQRLPWCIYSPFGKGRKPLCGDKFNVRMQVST